MATRSRNMNLCQNNRMSSYEADRMRALHAFGNLSSINPDAIGSAVPLSTNYLHNSMQNSSNSQYVPPPLPPRSDSTRQVDRYNRYPSGYNNYYSPYSRFSPGMYTPSYGGYGRSPYSRYGVPPHETYNSFIQLAEESTRPAFESIESVVDIVGSISMMLESTYHAVYSSYNAILGVVDQFARLKDHLAEVLSFLALIRGLKYLCLKILYLLRLRKDNPSVEAAWNTANSMAENDLSKFSTDRKSPWPFFMFVGLVIGAPWLMFKLLARSVTNQKPFDITAWKESDGQYRGASAAFDFNTNRRGELPFRAGEVLYLAPKQFQTAPKGWLLACNLKQKVGLIPANYLKTTTTKSAASKSAKPSIVVEQHRIPDSTLDQCSAMHASTSTDPDPSTSNEITNFNESLPDPFTAENFEKEKSENVI